MGFVIGLVISFGILGRAFGTVRPVKPVLHGTLASGTNPIAAGPLARLTTPKFNPVGVVNMIKEWFKLSDGFGLGRPPHGAVAEQSHEDLSHPGPPWCFLMGYLSVSGPVDRAADVQGDAGLIDIAIDVMGSVSDIHNYICSTIFITIQPFLIFRESVGADPPFALTMPPRACPAWGEGRLDVAGSHPCAPSPDMLATIATI